MDDIKRILEGRLKGRAANKRLHSPAHVLADEISLAYGERKRFAMYLGVINRVGVETARGVFRRLQQEKAGENNGKLFMYLCRKEPSAPKADPAATAPADPSPKTPNVLT